MKKKNKKHKQKQSIMFTFALIIIAALVVVYLILPVIFILLESVFPICIKGSGALKSLKDGVDSFVGYCGLIVGILSIIYAYISNKRLDEQNIKNDNFLYKLSEKIDDLQKSNTKLYDQVINNNINNIKKDNSI